MSDKITLKKETKEKVRNYLIKAMQKFTEDELGIDDIPSSIRFTYNTFFKEFDNEISRVGVSSALEKWLKALRLDVAYSNYNERELLKEWFNETDVESNLYSDEKVNSIYWKLITREFLALVEQYKDVHNIKKIEENFKPNKLDSYIHESTGITEDVNNNFKNLSKMQQILITKKDSEFKRHGDTDRLKDILFLYVLVREADSGNRNIYYYNNVDTGYTSLIINDVSELSHYGTNYKNKEYLINRFKSLNDDFIDESDSPIIKIKNDTDNNSEIIINDIMKLIVEI